MSRFYAPPENVRGDAIYIDGSEAKHILDVMRMGLNDAVVVFDGTGREYKGFIKEIKKGSLTVGIIETKTPRNEVSPAITLAQAIPKKQKMEYIVEKATELGVDTIIPLVTERGVVRPEKRKTDERVERWRRVAVGSSKQCGRPRVPDIKKIENFYDIINGVDQYDLSLIACLSDDTVPLKEALSGFERGKIIVFIGPEGDFTPDEIKAARNTSSKFVSLGPRVLKSDTAGLYLLSVLNYEFSS